MQTKYECLKMYLNTLQEMKSFEVFIWNLVPIYKIETFSFFRLILWQCISCFCIACPLYFKNISWLFSLVSHKLFSVVAVNADDVEGAEKLRRFSDVMLHYTSTKQKRTFHEKLGSQLKLIMCTGAFQFVIFLCRWKVTGILCIAVILNFTTSYHMHESVLYFNIISYLLTKISKSSLVSLIIFHFTSITLSSNWRFFGLVTLTLLSPTGGLCFMPRYGGPARKKPIELFISANVFGIFS